MFTRFRVFWVLVLNTNFCSPSRNPALHFELFPGERFPEVEWLAQRPWTFFRPGIHIAKFLSPRRRCHFSLPLTLLLIPFLMASLAEPANRKLHMSYDTSSQWITQPMDLIAGLWDSTEKQWGRMKPKRQTRAENATAAWKMYKSTGLYRDEVWWGHGRPETKTWKVNVVHQTYSSTGWVLA